MQPKADNTKALINIAQKELSQFFGAPIAWLFLGVFLMVTLFIFFWVESFFSRNIADVRPLFEWMPLLLIFLSAALTMKMWSEERKSGTLEYILTQPVPLWQFVVGKFLACWALLGLALLLTLPLPITVAMLGDLDWGPVLSGYLAALLLGGAYLSMGLFVSARCDNQIVSLILTVALAGGFYLIGAGVLTNLMGNSTADVMRHLGTGSRFESITRGVIDIRDLYYYLSLIVGFIVLNCFSLERGRWARDGNSQHHNAWRVGTALLVANAIFANVWLSQITGARVDTTQGGMYSISPATKNYLAQLQEPLLIRGYFSQKTHPLLAPLVPQMQDLLREYEVAGAGKVSVEIIDPTLNPEMEDEANTRYNIRPTPFRVNDRHQAALVNSYFDILVQYGSEHQVLSFNDLIEVKAAGQQMDVLLRNPEYDVTRMIKKSLYAYQAGGNIFDSMEEPITLTAYVSKNDLLPKELVELKAAIKKEVDSLKVKAGEKLVIKTVEPEANNGAEAKRIADAYGFAPMALGPLSPEQFYFYVTLGKGDQLLQVDLGDFSEGVFKESVNAGIKRFAQGFTRTIAIVAPQGMDPQAGMQAGQEPPNIPRFEGLKQILGQDMNVISEDLSDGSVNPSADILILAAPQLSDENQRFAVDQFLMRGGTVVVSTAPNSVKITRNNLSLDSYESGLTDWLQHYGVSFSDKVVMDAQNSAFPVPVVREVGGMRFEEVRMMDYPYFVSVRGEGLNEDSLITAGLPEVTMPWAASLLLDQTKLETLKTTPLLRSSAGSWLGDKSNILPTAAQLSSGFAVSGEQGSQLLGVALEGKFNSYFAGKDSPLVAKAEGSEEGDEKSKADTEQASTPVNRVISHSPDTARLIVFASNDVFRDQIIGMLGSSQGGSYLNTIQLVANTVDWALEDQGLLTIRSRGNFNRTLVPMELSNQQFWEYINYVLALIGLFIVWAAHHTLMRARRARHHTLLAA